MKTFLDNGNLTRSPRKQKTDFTFPNPSQYFSPVSTLIPTLSSVSGGRVLLSGKSFNQALSLTNRESPLVHSSSDLDTESFVSQYGKQIASMSSKEDGIVKEVTPDNIKVDNTNHEIYNNFLSGKKASLHFSPIVKVGDTVKKGDVLATSNYSDSKGNLALGVNLNTAIMPYRSGNFEDAFVVSESGAKKLQAEQLIPIRVELSRGIQTSKDKYVSLFANKFVNPQLAPIDEDGVIKKGSIVKMGDPLVLVMEPRTLKTLDVHLGNISKLLKAAYNDRSETWDYQHDGEVTDVAKNGSLITVTVKTKRDLETGDKLSNFGGSKGVCTIMPDSQVPQREDGTPVDLILNTMSITSRISPGIPITMAIGKVAQKVRYPIKVTPFIKGSSVEQAIELLKKHDVHEMETLYDPTSGTETQAFVGPLYTTRLAHSSEDKVSGRSEGAGYTSDLQPSKANEDSAKRIGNLATNALLAHDAKAFLKDVGVVRGTKNDDYWRALKLGQPLPTPKVPFVFEKFVGSMQGAGIKVTQNGDNFQLLPQTDTDVKKLSVGPIASPATYKLKNDQLIFERGGMFDENIVGLLGNQFNHIELHQPVPNPISEDYLRKLLKVTKKDYYDMAASGELEKKLKSMNVDKLYDEYVKKAKVAKKSDKDDVVKVLGFLKNLKRNGIGLKDLLLHNIPVIPAQYRPISVQGGRVMSTGINELYRDLILNNNAIKSGQEAGVPPEILEEARRKQYDAVKAVYGLGDPISARNLQKGFKGILGNMLGIKGGSAKESFFQAKVINKPVDLVGRAVLTPDVKLNLDEASVPAELLWKVYSPFLIKRLVSRGVPATNAKEYVEKQNPIALQSLREELLERPGVISRDPQLHKSNIQAFYLKPNPNPKDHTVKLNPLVYKGFNADNDGDQLNIQIPASEDARLETIEKMKPSVNLISPANFMPNYTPSNEAALGIYLMSTENNNKPPKIYSSTDEVFKDFSLGKLNVDDQVEIKKS